MNRKRGKALPSLFPFLNTKVKALFYLLLIAATFTVKGQNLRCEQFAIQSHIVLDEFPIEPGSIALAPSGIFSLDEKGQGIYLDSTFQWPDTISICFRTVSSLFREPTYNRHIREYNQGFVRHPSELVLPEEQELFDMGHVNSYGAISRGITFGNQQNVFVNSALNLQMDGQLTDDLKISAVITDQNIPYQPEGNTQQLRDFDNVFIKFYNERFQLRAGDIVLSNPVNDAYFLKYYKNVQGLETRYDSKIGEKWKAHSQLSGALAKGQFSTVVITPIEGIQGPYKLRGANGERFIIILANSEKIYFDGKLLERGFDRDYVIDYNLGEITFSNTVVVTRFSRIRVDYEYATQSYSRSNIAFSESLTSDKSHLYFNFYQEKDNRSNALTFAMNPDDERLLAEAGDSHGVAAISGVDTASYNDQAILYEKLDTIVNGVQQTIYRYSSSEQLAHHKISFTEVGESQGAYNLVKSTANGKIYEWVGEGLGSYTPVRLVPLPNQKQLMIFGWKQQLTSFEHVFQELAISNRDMNLYSSQDDNDNVGWAWKAGVQSLKRPVKDLKDYHFNALISYEFDQQNFRPIDRFRGVDFDRDWNYDVFADSVLSRADQILIGKIGIENERLSNWNYEFSSRNRSGAVSGVKHQMDVCEVFGKSKINSHNMLSYNNISNYSSKWIKSFQEVIWQGKWIRPGYAIQLDQQQTFIPRTDSILRTQMHYQANNWFLESGDSLGAIVRLDYIRRKDQLPEEGELLPYTDAQEFRFSFANRSWENHQLSAQINYRYVEELQNQDKGEAKILGKFSWLGSFAQKHITSNMRFSTASVRELRREFIYISVPTGQGTHTWRDENGDGLQDINEFYEAVNADEKNYIKLFTPTDEYINAYQTIYTHTVDIKAPKSWKDLEWLKIPSRLSFNGNIQQNIKTTAESLLDRLNLMGVSLADEAIVSARNLNRYTFFYNRNAPGLSCDATYISQASKSLLGGGFETASKKGWEMAIRFAPIKELTLRSKGGIRSNDHQSDFLQNRNFQIAERQLESEIVWQPNNQFRLITGVGIRNKQNEMSELSESANIQDYKFELTWMKSSNGNLNASFNWLDINFEGNVNTYSGYELLEALQPGTNQRWNVNWQQAMGKGLQLTLQYFGRKSADKPVVQTGSVMVTAFF